MIVSALRSVWDRSRPVDPRTAAALAARWAELPDAVRTPAQLMGRHTPGCEGTHGTFPRCNLACTPCYHAREANSVRPDADHTEAAVAAQMELLRRLRGPGQHAQLIGGEVTLLGPEGHARALQAMERHGRKPMSMTHGDFDYDYLEQLAVGPDGRRRFRLLRFAGHFDSLMLGRRGVARPGTETELHPARRAFVENFKRLRREYGVRFDLAHNMTVTPRNLDQVGEVARVAMEMGYGMASFQPAAYVGNPKRCREGYRELTIDAVWREIERGIGVRLPWQHLQVGDPRCNRSAYGVVAGGRWVPLLDDRDPRDLRVRDMFLDSCGGIDVDRPPLVLVLMAARVVARRPAVVPAALAWGWRLAGRIGVRRLMSGSPRAMTFVVHAFMDAAVVRPAWEALERGEVADEPEVRADQERLQACSYAMAHPETGRLVPACVQHSVLDPVENIALRELLPLQGRR
ncbi:MAG: radical SAM domain-containing protein [Acidobacteriota bacterium]|nr:radical SAM domain-containing protein [Acidobacteriota bacterium]